MKITEQDLKKTIAKALNIKVTQVNDSLNSNRMEE